MDRKVSLRRRKYRKHWTERCKDYLRNFLAFMFSNVGIIGLVVGYTVAGAFIFILIEGQVEKDVRKSILISRNTRADNIWIITNKTNILEEAVWKLSVIHQLQEYQSEMAKAIRGGYDGSDNLDENKAWSFPGAFLYSLTVITTIGYGNVVPRTKMGKIITIIYAIIGMPLFLLYLSNIGDVLAKSFKWLYAKVCLCKCCPGVSKKRAERQRRRTQEFSVEYLNNQRKSESPEVHVRRAYNFKGLEMSYGERYNSGVIMDGSESQTETEVSDDVQAITVPLTVCLVIMVGYILGGALLFSKYESHWSTLDGSYFCFISLSTIGFGDLVPGKAMISDQGFELSTIFGSMYLMLGMALIAMCFNLMQEEVVRKIRTTIRTVKYMFRCNR